jgi:hypothetical protein
MKVREIMQLTKRDPLGIARSVAGDRTPQRVARVDIPNAIAGRQKALGSQDVFAVADANGEVTGKLPRVVDGSPEISTPHSRDVEFITAQMARLPRPADR